METHSAAGDRRVWDVPVRVFHWSTVACFVAAWLTREAPRFDLHAAFGHAFVVLLLFRVAWGFFGSATARFASFVTRPGAAWAYLRATLAHAAPRFVGHNPAGGWSVVVMIVLGLGVSVTGVSLMSAQFELGLLGGAVAPTAGLWLLPLHEGLAWAMLALVGVHLAGVWWSSRSHRENLVVAMLTGRKAGVPVSVPAVPRHATPAVGLLLVVFGAAGGTLWSGGWLERGSAEVASPGARGAAASVTREGGPGSVPDAWRTECSPCHLPYPPELLPARSWRRMLDEQDRHFGEDLGLSAATAEALHRIAAAADGGTRWAGLAMRASVPTEQAPMRITETPFWQARHHRVEAGRFKSGTATGRHDCEACHRDALSAIFSPREFRNTERGSQK